MTPKNTLEGFWSRVNKEGDCWEWTGTIATTGYGHFKLDGKLRLAHRLAWEFANGAIPANLVVCHKCDNRRCVCPDHLWLGTLAENNADMKSKGRSRGGRPPGASPLELGENNVHAKLTNDQVREIRALHASGTMTKTAIGRRFGVCEATIRKIVNGETWTHLKDVA